MDEWMNTLDDVKRQAVRSEVIQHFEVTYELSWKLTKRWLSLLGESFAVEGVSRRQLFRLAAEHRLIDDVEKWMRYHEARNEDVAHL